MTIRSKLTMAAVVVTVLANSLLLLVALQYMEHVWMNEVQTQVALDLNSARAAYRGHVAVIDAFLRAWRWAGRWPPPSSATIAPRSSRSWTARIAAEGMDFLSLADPRGKVVCRARTAPTAAATIFPAIRSSPAR